jgi:hypothetical protein
MREAGVAAVVGLVLAASSLAGCADEENPLLTGSFLTTVESTAPPVATTEAAEPTTTAPATTEPATTVSTTAPATTAPATTLPPLTFAEIGAALNAPASAYIQSRGAAEEQELFRRAAEQLIATGRTGGLPAIPTPDGEASVSVLLEFLAAQPDFVWVKALERGGVLSGLPIFYLDGLYVVGTDVMPGSYEAFDVEYCFWQRMDAQGRQIDSFYTELAPRATATIAASDYAFASKECGIWFRIG